MSWQDDGDFHRGMGRKARPKARHFDCRFCGITFWGLSEHDRLDMYMAIITLTHQND